MSNSKTNLDLERSGAEALIRKALREDIGSGDHTTRWIIPPRARGAAALVFKEQGVLAGIDLAERTWQILDRNIVMQKYFSDGDHLPAGAVAARVSGTLRALLTGERTALNFLQRLSGIATVTAEFVKELKGTEAVILDTRKTLPGFRTLDKYAVRVGGGSNHRHGLFDMILIKENHQRLPGGIEEAVERVRRRNRPGLEVEVEVGNLDEFRQVVGLSVDRIMLDNMNLHDIAEAAREVSSLGPGEKRPQLEVSGNVTLENVREIAETGVDFISVGSLTHSVRAIDMSFLVDR